MSTSILGMLAFPELPLYCANTRPSAWWGKSFVAELAKISEQADKAPSHKIHIRPAPERMDSWDVGADMDV